MSEPVDDRADAAVDEPPWDEALLSAPPEPSRAGDFAPAPAASPPEATAHAFSTCEGERYAHAALLGAGGMGRVCAVHDQRLQRPVAVKTLPPDAAQSPALRERLAREAWITAQLEHPHIVPVYDAGQALDGSLYYVMRMVRGRSLQETIEATPALAERLRLVRHFLDVCEAIAYAHSIGIVHRDLKPQNVMIGEFGETQVVDWGLARPVELRDAPWSLATPAAAEATRAGAVVGTPAYMSPEQARGEEATEASDVWSLGAMLYVLLTRRTPFEGESAAMLAALQSRPAERRAVRERCPDAPPDLATIAERALSPRPADRYGSAAALARDVAAWLDGRRVEAHAYSRQELLWRFVEAWRVPLAMGALALVALAVVGAVAYGRVVDEKTRAARAERTTQDSLELADHHLAAALLEQALTLAALEARPEAETLAAHVLAHRESPAARGVLATFGVAQPPRLVERLEDDLLPRCVRRVLSSHGGSLLCMEEHAVSLWSVAGPRLRWRAPFEVLDGAVIDGARYVVVHLSATEDALLEADGGEVVERFARASGPKPFLTFGQMAATSTAPPAVAFYDLDSGERRERSVCATGAYGPAIALDDAARRLVVYCNDDQTLHVGPLDAAGELQSRHLPLEGGLSVLALSPDGAHVVGGNTRGEVVLVELARGVVVRRHKTDAGVVAQVAFAADGEQVLVAGERGGVRVWHLASGGWTARLPRRSGRRFGVGAAARELVVDSGASLERWLLPEAPQPHQLLAAEPVPIGLSSASLSARGTELVAHRGNGTMVVVDTRDGRQLARVDLDARLDAPVKHGTWSSDGGQYRPINASHPSAVYDAATWRPLSDAAPTPTGRRIEVMQGPVTLTVGYGEGKSRWVAEGAPWEGAAVSTGALVDLGVEPGGRFAAALTEHAPQRVWRLSAEGGAVHQTPLFEVDDASAVDLTADGETVVVARRDQVQVRASGAGASEVRTLETLPGTTLLDVALSPDDRRVAASDLAGELWVWSLDSGRLLARLRGHTSRVVWLEFDPEGESLYSASWDGTVRHWDLRRLEVAPEQLLESLEGTWGLTQEAAIGGGE